MKLFSIILFSTFAFLSIAQPSLRDTLVVEKNSVVFFSLTTMEFDSLIKVDPDVNEVISDFNYHAGNLKESIESLGYKFQFTAHRFYRIRTKTKTANFDRLKGDHVVGMILNNGTNYKIDFGVDTDVGYLQTIKAFMKK